jgi:hypothetical protein
MLLAQAWQVEAHTIESLEAITKHRAISDATEAPADVHDPSRIDSHEVAVIGEMVHCAESDPTDDSCDPRRLDVLDDVRRLNE